MTATLHNPELKAFVEEQVRCGRFRSADEALEAAVARLMLEETASHLTAEDLAAIAEGDRDVERGEVIDFDAYAAAVRSAYRK